MMMSIGVSRILQWKGSTGGGFRKFSKGVEPRGLGDPWVQRQSPSREFGDKVPQKLKQNVKLVYNF